MIGDRHGILFLISAPSGGGKSTLLKLLGEKPDFSYSVSCTTRAPRPGEVHGRDYHFLELPDFERRVSGGEFLEHARVHGNYYGTLRENIVRELAAGRDVLMDVDTQGAAQIRSAAAGDDALTSALVDIFLMPPSMEELERRLRNRGTETEDQLRVRLGNAADEIAQWKNYRYTLVSGKPEDDFAAFRAVMNAERARSVRFGAGFVG